jgi:DNA-directed RNA polymerase subunit beta
MIQRKNFGKHQDVIQPPDLIEIQTRSYRDFLQAEVPAAKREKTGLQAVFSEVFPIESYDGQSVLDFVKYEIRPPAMGPVPCLREGQSYTAPLYVTFRIKDAKETREEEVYMGEIPLITEPGTFIINGAERVVVSQLHRSPGICFEQGLHANGTMLYSFRIIPDRGSWMEVQFDAQDLLNVYLDRKKRRRKFLASTFLRALLCETAKDGSVKGTDDDLLKLYYSFETLTLDAKLKDAALADRVLRHDVIDVDAQNVLARAYDPLTPELIKQIKLLGLRAVEVVNVAWDEGLFLKTLRKDPTRSGEEALKDIYTKLRPGDPPTLSNARQLMKRVFFDENRYNLTRVGRYKIQQKLGEKIGGDSVVLSAEDVIEGVRYLVGLRMGRGMVDDIDHLGSRRIRTVGELLESQCRLGLARTERLVRERMTIFDSTTEKLSPQKLINPKALSTVIKDFFGRSQLSQFMDQTNPLSELTHKRRLSALGPGGLSRERAGFEVRDVHASHYGRICPIETPEGPNIGLISSLSMFAQVNEFGFIETPYRKVEKGRVTEQVDFLTADQEEKFIIAQANAPLEENGRFKNDTVMVRKGGEFLEVPREDVHYMDVSPKQVVSIAAALIPFLEHDDANRALMGSNMQRQAVPLLEAERPYVATGNEERLARDSRVLVTARHVGRVAYVSADRIIVTADGTLPKSPKDPMKIVDGPDGQVYELRKFMRSNAGTCFNQKPSVTAGQRVTRGQVLADGPGTREGELSLGRNILVAFMPWCGYNFEDAIIINERLVKEDVYTSIHIEEFECGARDTKLGPEEITRDIPNVGEEALKNLTHGGVVRIGAEVKPGDILVGKITPKTETELAPEERLLRAIFGEKAADVRDTSLRVPSGTTGIVMEVKTSSRSAQKRSRVSDRDKRMQKKQIEDEYEEKHGELTEQLTGALANILLGEKIPLDVVNVETGEKIIPANRKITKLLLRKLASAREHIEIDASPVEQKIRKILGEFNRKFNELEQDRQAAMDRIDSGDDVDPGIIKQVKVYVATKKKLSVGDKMAGRHGNKGVIAKIVAQEDMPFLADGTPVDIVLNPLGVPSRMNVGQVLETHLGMACRYLGMYAATPVFDGISEEEIHRMLNDAKAHGSCVDADGKATLMDGRTGDTFDQRVVVGVIYMMKLHHLVTDKIHARAVGPYSLVTQQPLGGKAQYGGQRFGEMEVWAMEAYGAAYALQELLTVKSDDINGRTKIYESIVKGENVLDAGLPESFNVLMKEMQSLGLDIKINRVETL